MTGKYKSLDNKIAHLRKTQNQDTDQLPNKDNSFEFYPRVTNLTDIQFSDTEMTLLRKGLKYNIRPPQKQWIKTLAIEAETAVHLLPHPDQHPIRYQVAKTLDKLITEAKNPSSKKTSHIATNISERKTIQDIRTKLLQHNATITKADKGQTLIIITLADYNTKTYQFLNNTHFKMNRADPTNTYQKEVKKVIKKCPILIQQTTTWKYSTMHPQAPNLKALIKIHKQNAPIRPIVNWQHAPAYRLAKHLSDTLKHMLQLPFTFNVQNSQQLMTELHNDRVQP
jgi:hypothetical protein